MMGERRPDDIRTPQLVRYALVNAASTETVFPRVVQSQNITAAVIMKHKRTPSNMPLAYRPQGEREKKKKRSKGGNVDEPYTSLDLCSRPLHRR